MSAKDKYHDLLKQALLNEDWKITHDPYVIGLQGVNYQIDLGAEKVIAAEKENKKIAIEVKSFLKESIVSEYHTALGQFLNYRIGLEEIEAERILYLAIPDLVYERFLKLPIILKSIKIYQIKLIIYDVKIKSLLKWID